MKTRYLLLTFYLSCSGSSLAAYATKAPQASDTDNAAFKTAIMDSYLQRCVEVLNSKGYSSDAIKAECKCELDQIEQHFNVFSMMLNAATTDMAVTAAEQQQINDFKTRLLQCKNKLATD